jgi:hypothetical protein
MCVSSLKIRTEFNPIISAAVQSTDLLIPHIPPASVHRTVMNAYEVTTNYVNATHPPC